MPDVDSPDERQPARLLTALLWTGVSIAPVAVLVALVGDSAGATRFAVLLVAVAVVLVGASQLIRNDPVLLRLDAEDLLNRQTEMLRDRVQGDITAADRATRADLEERLEELHRRLVAVQLAQNARAAAPSAAAPPAPPPPPPARPAAPGVAGAVGAVRAGVPAVALVACVPARRWRGRGSAAAPTH